MISPFQNTLLILVLISFISCREEPQMLTGLHCDNSSSLSAPENYEISSINVQDMFLQLTNFYMSSPNDGYFIRGRELFKTTDGCKTWNKISSPILTNDADLMFVEKDVGFLYDKEGDSPAIHKTENGGEVWSRLMMTNFTGYVSKLIKDESQNIFAMLVDEENQTILKSEDYGLSWNAIIELGDVQTGYKQFKFKVSHDLIFASVEEDSIQIITTNGEVVSKFDGGISLWDISVLDSSTFILENSNSLKITEDSGNTWSDLYLDGGRIIDITNGDNLLAILEKDECVDYDISWSNHVVAYSSNKGKDWIEGDTIFNRLATFDKSFSISIDSHILQTGREFILLKEK